MVIGNGTASCGSAARHLSAQSSLVSDMFQKHTAKSRSLIIEYIRDAVGFLRSFIYINYTTRTRTNLRRLFLFSSLFNTEFNIFPPIMAFVEFL
jgi:hypothetical protein